MILWMTRRRKPICRNLPIVVHRRVCRNGGDVDGGSRAVRLLHPPDHLTWVPRRVRGRYTVTSAVVASKALNISTGRIGLVT